MLDHPSVRFDFFAVYVDTSVPYTVKYDRERFCFGKGEKMYIKFLTIVTVIVTFFSAAFAPLSIRIGDYRKTDFTQVKNVIFMIGDGMGFNSINKTKAEEGIDSLAMDSFPIQGESKTRSSDNRVTDSAAGGTALSSAVRTKNGVVGCYSYDKYDLVSHPMNLAELALSMGKKAGVITTDSTSGATPAAFSSHTDARGNEADITYQQIRSGLDLIWGTKTDSFSEAEAAEYGYTFIDDKTDMELLEEGSRSFGQFRSSVWHQVSSKSMPTISEMTVKAIDLLDDDEDGFFLMVEGAHIDKNSHSNDGEGMKDALLAFDKAVGAALKYAETHDDTIVLVTADHETGGITLNNGVYEYTSTNHTGANVPLLVYGCDDFMKNGASIKNREVARRVACAMGEEKFPLRVKPPAEHGERELPDSITD